MKRLGTAIQVLLAIVLLTYAVDWGLMRFRMSKGTALRTVQVEEYLSTPLKGNKEEYDYMGTQAESCSVTLFPQSGYTPCWWLEKHRQHWQR